MDAVNARFTHPFSSEDLDRFERDGYVLIRGALDHERLAMITAASDDCWARHGRININQHDLFCEDERFLDLIDLPSTFTPVWSILGWNIQCFHTQLLVNEPESESRSGRWGWHQDNNRMNRDLEVAVHPRISLKLGYFLTACDQPWMGNFACVPGSHRTRELTYSNGSDLPDGTEQLCVQAGDAVLFDRRLWHTRSPNTAGGRRKVIYVGYSYRWLRPKSEMDHRALLERTTDPIRRQLLGWASSANGRYDPTPEDVPLRESIRAAFGDPAVRP